MAFLVVVRRDAPALFRHLHELFPEPGVAVVMGRRTASGSGTSRSGRTTAGSRTVA